jgi:hypothetical protein
MNDNLNQGDSQAADTLPRNGNRGFRRFAFLAGGLSVSAVAAYLIAKALGGGEAELPDNIVDDRGTGQRKAARILQNLRNRAFESSDEKLALALGRPVAEVTAWQAGSEIIDDDVIMKARGIAFHRGVYVE